MSTSPEFLFINDSRHNYTYPSAAGVLQSYQLWSLPLQSVNANKANLNSIAVGINSQIKAAGEESFVENRSNPALTELKEKLEIVKFIIATKQEENRIANQKAANATRAALIRGLLENKAIEKLSSASEAELQAELASLT